MKNQISSNKVLILFISILVFFNLLSGKTNYSKVEGSRKMVVLIHGLMDNPFIMYRLQKTMLRENYSVLNFDYKSTKWSMDSIITKLDNSINQLDSEIDSIYFVVHSMGTFVVRGYLSETVNPKVKKIVMIAPPNKGSILAEKLDDSILFEWMFGESGQKLGKDSSDFWKTYPRPSIPFGIIAGGINTQKGFNPAIPGDDDGVVAVHETVLRGYSDLIKIPGLHTTLPWQDNVIEQTLYFFNHGEFNH